MTTRRWMLLALMAALLAIGAAACGGEAAPTPTQPAAASAIVTVVVTSPPEPTATLAASTSTSIPEPTAVAQPTSTPEPAVSLSEVAKEKLSSYRSAVKITITGTKDGKAAEESVEVMTEFVREPIAQHVVMTTSSTEMTQTGTIELYQVGGMQYMLYGDQWFSSPLTDTSSIESQELVSPADVLTEACAWQDKGKETLEGVRVRHWTLPESTTQECFAGLNLQEAGQLTAAGGDLYVTEDGEYVAKMNLHFEGSEVGLLGGTGDVVLDQGRTEIVYSMSDVNQPITIEVPEAAIKATALPEDVPLPPDAIGASQSFGMITFTSPSTVKEVQDFFVAEMPNHGWTVGEVVEYAGINTITCTKEGKKAEIWISPDQNGVTSVMIAVTEE